MGTGIININMRNYLMLKTEQIPNAENLQEKNYNHSQTRDKRKLYFAFIVSFTAINAAKIMMK